jgi:hypothetical protein
MPLPVPLAAPNSVNTTPEETAFYHHAVRRACGFDAVKSAAGCRSSDRFHQLFGSRAIRPAGRAGNASSGEAA